MLSENYILNRLVQNHPVYYSKYHLLVVTEMKIILGCDHAGLELKEKIAQHLKESGFLTEDIGTYSADSVDYPIYARRVAQAVAAGRADRGILVCGSGLGMCITANRIPGVRAVQVSEPYAAKMSRRHNDSNVLCLAGRLLGQDLAMEIVDVWLNEYFEGGRHQRRVEMIDRLNQPADCSEPNPIGK
jgi:ribose 5-phosphate isomerase B